MGPEDNANSMDNLYLITEDGYKVPMTTTMFCIPDLIDVDMEPEIVDHYADHLPFIEGTMTFAFKDPYISRKLLRPVRRWSRKKDQQRKRKLAKEKKHGLLHEET